MQLLHSRMSRHGHDVMVGRAAVCETRRAGFAKPMHAASVRRPGFLAPLFETIAEPIGCKRLAKCRFQKSHTVGKRRVDHAGLPLRGDPAADRLLPMHRYRAKDEYACGDRRSQSGPGPGGYTIRHRRASSNMIYPCAPS